MKPTKILSTTLVLFIIASSFSIALALSWHERFVSNYEDQGIDLAVETALSEGASPNQIIKKALPIEGLEKGILVKALFCSGAKPEKVKSAAAANNIDETIVNDGYQLALTECGRQMEENFNIIPPGSSARALSSPWKFKK